MTCDLYQIAENGSQFGSLPKWQYNIYRLYVLALLLKAVGGEDLTDMAALIDQVRAFGKLSQADLQAAYLQVIVESLSGTEIPAPTEAQLNAVLQAGQCTPEDLIRKAEICVLKQLLQQQA